MRVLLAGLAIAALAAPVLAVQEPVTAGRLTLRASGSTVDVEAPAVSTDVSVIATGIVARATVRHVFRNPLDAWMEGTYLFPLPESAAVDHLRIEAGDRVIEGVIREREEARKTYEQARDAGQRAALLDQSRANLFQASVANVPPGEDVTVVIEFQQRLRLDGDTYRFRFPLAVTPRYHGGVPLAANREEPDPSVDPPCERRDPDVAIVVELDAGAPLANVASPSHDVAIEDLGKGARRVTLSPPVEARDFELEWTLVPATAPRAAFFVEPGRGATHGLLVVMPPHDIAGGPAPLREVIFVIDSSGSMGGESMRQAQAALQLAIDRLQPDDTFDVVDFDSAVRTLWDAPRAADDEARTLARDWVESLVADGGTEIVAALETALAIPRDPSRLRQVVFLTDGAVGNETDALATIESRLGDARLFTVGIGAAPNAWLMTKAAEAGRGTYTFIARIEEVATRTSELLRQLESPVMTDVTLEWPDGVETEAWPEVLPDLYAGEPLTLSVALSKAAGVLRVSGLRGDTAWSREIDLGASSEGDGIGVLWARAKIDALMDGLHRGTAEADVRAAVVDVALEHHLVTRYTSLVAVDATPVRAPGEPQVASAIPTALPVTWTGGRLPVGGTGFRLDVIAGVSLVMTALTLWVAGGRRRRAA